FAFAAALAVLWSDDRWGWPLCAALLAFALRFKSGLMLLPLLLLCGVCRFWQSRERFPLAFCAGVLAFAAVFFAADGALYRAHEPGWDEQVAYDKARTELMDYRSAPETWALAQDELGWSGEYVSMASNWYFLDDRFTTETAQTLSELADAQSSFPSLALIARRTGSMLWQYAVFRWHLIALGLTALLALWPLLKQKRWPEALCLAGALAYAVAVTAWFYGVRGRFPDRVAVLAALPAYVCAAVISLRALSGKKLLCAALAVALAGGATFAAAPESVLVPRWKSGARTSQAEASGRLNEYALAHADTLFVTDTAQSFLAEDARAVAPNLLEWGNAMLRSPMYRRKLEALGRAGFDSANLADEGVRLLISDSAALERLQAYLNADFFPCEAVCEEEGAGFTV
ncbi:MAG: hypothetical protein PHY12_11770, partial [Eubacteriales bacterium]|nr:hypothetical protein [Eubacteriales bacterium]